jgi:hypothetical protein
LMPWLQIPWPEDERFSNPQMEKNSRDDFNAQSK